MTSTTSFTFNTESLSEIAVAYASADTKEKARIRTLRDAAKASAMAAVIGASDPDETAAAVAVMAAVVAYDAVLRTEKASPVRDYASDAADRVAALYAAADAILAGDVRVPDGAVVPSSADVHAALSRRGLVAEAPSAYVTLSGRKASRAADGAVARYVVAALSADEAPSAMTAAMVARSGVSTDDYADGSHPSVGAIGAFYVRDDSDAIEITAVDGVPAARLV